MPKEIRIPKSQMSLCNEKCRTGGVLPTKRPSPVRRERDQPATSLAASKAVGYADRRRTILPLPSDGRGEHSEAQRPAHRTGIRDGSVPARSPLPARSGERIKVRGTDGEVSGQRIKHF